MTDNAGSVAAAEERLTRAAGTRAAQIHASLRSAEVVARLAQAGKQFELPVVPGLLSQDQVRRLQTGFDAITTGMQLVWERAFHGDVVRLLEYVGFDVSMASLYEDCGSDRWWRVARPDIVFAGGDPWFVEMNHGSTIGGLHLFDSLAAAFVAADRSGVLTAEGTASSFEPLRRVAALVREESGTGAADPDILVVDWRRHLLDADGAVVWAYRELAEGLTGFGIKARCASVEELGEFTGRDFDRYDLVYRFFETPELDDSAAAGLLRRIATAMRSSGTAILDSTRSDPLRDKAMLAAVCDDRFRPVLGADLAAAIDAVVPWTRTVVDRRSTDPQGAAIDLMSWVARNRERLILKPARGAHGRDVLIGAETTEHDWGQAVDRTLRSRDRWLVQELIHGDPARITTWAGHPEPVSAERRAVYGAYFVDGRSCGVSRRSAVTESASRNIAGDIGISPVFVV